MQKDTSNNLKWVLPTILIVSILVIVIALRSSKLPYELSSEQMLSETLKQDNKLDKNTLSSVTNSLLIDLRQPLEYNLGHVKNAINIPAEKIFGDEYLRILNEMDAKGNVIILYCNTPQKASGAWMMLKQIGIKNVRYFNGTFEQLVSNDELANSKYNESPAIDTALLKSITSTVNSSTENKPTKQPVLLVPQRKAPASPTGGGC